MFNAVFFTNALDPGDREHFYIEPGRNFIDWLVDDEIGDVMCCQPVFVLKNGEELLEKDFDFIVDEDDLFSFAVMPEYEAMVAVFLFIGEYWAIIQFVIVAALYLTQDEPSLPDGAQKNDGSPTYSIGARGNRARLGEPKPVLYGAFRVYPDLASIPFSDFERGNHQYLYQLFEVAQGDVDIDTDSIRFSDTPLTDFSDVELEIIPPGEKSTLFPSVVNASTEIQNLDIGSVWLGPFTLVEPNKRAVRIAWDVTAPRGLFYSDRKTGNIRAFDVEVAFDLREIDDGDNPIGGFVEVLRHKFSGTNQTTIRETLHAVVAPGRYETRIRRIDAPRNDIYVSDELILTQVKAFLEDDTGVTSTTRMAIKIRASEKIGNRALSQMNVVATGKVPVWDAANGWSAPVATANPAWVFADVARANYGGRRSDSHIDLPALAALAPQFESEGVEFNGVFDTAGNVWSALEKVCQVGRARPIDRGGVYTMVRDSYSTQPVMMFTQRNIIKNSFSITYTGVLEETADAVRVLFNDAQQDYRQAPMLCALPGSPAANPRDVRFFGVTDKDQAFKLGMGLAAENQFRRQNITFDAGFDGVIPFFGDVIAISHYLIGREGFQQVSGDVRHFNGADELRLSERVDHIQNPFIALKNLDGSPTDFYQCAVMGEDKIRIIEPFDESGLVFEHGHNRPQFMLGEGVNFSAIAKVRSIEPLEDNRYRIVAFVDDPQVYVAADGLQVPPIDTLPPQIQIAPLVNNLKASLTGTVEFPQVILTWDAENADFFQVEYSVDLGDTWITFAERPVSPEFIHAPEPGVVQYRVAGVNILRGAFATVTIDTNNVQFTAPPAADNLQLREAFVGKILKLQWDSFTEDHRIVFSKGGVEKYAETISGTEYDLHYERGAEFALGRGFDVEVFAVGPNKKIATTAPLLAVANPAPPQLNNFSVNIAGDKAIITFDIPQDLDFAGVSVWVAGSNGFSPNDATLVIRESLDPVLQIPLEVDVDLFVRAAATDFWGSVASELNVSGQVTARGVDFNFLVDDDIIETRHLVDAAITAAKMAANSVGDAQLIASAIKAIHIAADAIQTQHLSAGVIVSDKIAADAILTLHLAANQIIAAHIQAGAINANHINVSTLSAISASLGTVVAGLFKTSAGSGARVEIDSAGSKPFWIGEGAAKNAANAHVDYDSATKTWTHFDSSSGIRFEIQPGSDVPFFLGSGAKTANNSLLSVDSSGLLTIRGVQVLDGANNVLLSSSDGFSGLGSFAFLDQLTSGNISTYMAGAAIGTAQIKNLAVDYLQLANGAVGHHYFADTGYSVFPMAPEGQYNQRLVLPIAGFSGGGTQKLFFTWVMYGSYNQDPRVFKARIRVGSEQIEFSRLFDLSFEDAAGDYSTDPRTLVFEDVFSGLSLSSATNIILDYFVVNGAGTTDNLSLRDRLQVNIFRD